MQKCSNHKDRPAHHRIFVEGEIDIFVCTPCFNDALKKKFVCKWCKVPVVSRSNHAAILGRVHGKHCPRRFK